MALIVTIIMDAVAFKDVAMDATDVIMEQEGMSKYLHNFMQNWLLCKLNDQDIKVYLAIDQKPLVLYYISYQVDYKQVELSHYHKINTIQIQNHQLH